MNTSFGRSQILPDHDAEKREKHQSRNHKLGHMTQVNTNHQSEHSRMKRLISLLSLACCLLFSTATYAQNTPEIAKGNCDACIKECEQTLDYCTKKGGKYTTAQITTALKDCQAACRMTSEILGRGSSLSNHAAAFCVEACNNCAKSCESFKGDDRLRACADECRKASGNCGKLK